MDQGEMPPGFWFAPSDEEMVSYYLRGKIKEGRSPAMEGLIVGYDIYGCDPWDLPRGEFRYPGPQRDMYFFTPTHPPAKSSSSSSCKRRARTAGSGVWHGNGKDNLIMGWDDSRGRVGVVGHKTSFKFEIIPEAEAEKGRRIKTDWLMQEYRLQPTGADADAGADASSSGLVLCRIYKKEKANVGVGWDGEPQPLPRRKRPVPEEEPPEQDASTDMGWWEGGTKEEHGTSSDQGPTPKRRRLAQPVPVPDDDDHQDAFALELEGILLDTDEPEAPPVTLALPSSTPQRPSSSAPMAMLSPDTPFLPRSYAGAGHQADPIVLDDDADDDSARCFPVADNIVASPSPLPPSCDQEDWDPMLYIDFDTFLDPDVGVEAWIDHVLALDEPALDPLPCLLPSPPLDAQPLPSSSSLPPMSTDVHPVTRCPDQSFSGNPMQSSSSSHDVFPIEDMDASPSLLTPTAPPEAWADAWPSSYALPPDQDWDPMPYIDFDSFLSFLHQDGLPAVVPPSVV